MKNKELKFGYILGSIVTLVICKYSTTPITWWTILYTGIILFVICYDKVWETVCVFLFPTLVLLSIGDIGLGVYKWYEFIIVWYGSIVIYYNYIHKLNNGKPIFVDENDVLRFPPPTIIHKKFPINTKVMTYEGVGIITHDFGDEYVEVTYPNGNVEFIHSRSITVLTDMNYH